MNFHVYIEDELQKQLDEYCRSTGKKRNTVVREALRKHLPDKKMTRREWREFIRNFPYDPDFPPFESHRSELLPPREDIFGDNG